MNRACLDCAWFAGRSRDRQATLFKIGKGYCDHIHHPGGVWNVVQSIVRPNQCERFEAAPENIISQRWEAAKKLMKEEKRG